MPDEIIGSIKIEEDPQAYESLWDTDWADKLDKLVGNAKILRRHQFDLLFTWKAATTHTAHHMCCCRL
jgi:hypothetical protein